MIELERAYFLEGEAYQSTASKAIQLLEGSRAQVESRLDARVLAPVTLAIYPVYRQRGGGKGGAFAVGKALPAAMAMPAEERNGAVDVTLAVREMNKEKDMRRDEPAEAKKAEAGKVTGASDDGRDKQGAAAEVKSARAIPCSSFPSGSSRSGT